MVEHVHTAACSAFERDPCYIAPESERVDPTGPVGKVLIGSFYVGILLVTAFLLLYTLVAGELPFE